MPTPTDRFYTLAVGFRMAAVDKARELSQNPRNDAIMGRAVEAIEQAEDAVFHALNVLGSHLDDQKAEAAIRQHNAGGMRPGSTQ